MAGRRGIAVLTTARDARVVMFGRPQLQHLEGLRGAHSSWRVKDMCNEVSAQTET